MKPSWAMCLSLCTCMSTLEKEYICIVRVSVPEGLCRAETRNL